MKKWMPLSGNFTENESNIVFQGFERQSSSDSAHYNLLESQIAPIGVILFEDIMSDGYIETSIEFEQFGEGDLAQIIFNYQNRSTYMCAGVGNTEAKYGVNVTNGQVCHTIAADGFAVKLPITQFNMKIQLIGSYLELWVNNIRVLTATIPYVISPSQVGVLIRSKEKVTIGNFMTSCRKPEIFIISQFGGDYDILYNDVIGPICEKLGYKPIRGDEITSCTMIINDIANSIRNSAVIIADISPDNPNVFYEVGYAHALNKPTILLCEKSIRSKLPFDVSGFRTIFYDNSIGGKKKVEEKLEDYLKKASIFYGS